MNSRPLAITIVGWLFIATGCISFVGGFMPHRNKGTTQPVATSDENHILEDILVSALRLSAVVVGAFLLRGCNWARWLLIAWMAFHVGISVLHSPFEVLVHVLFMAVLVYLMYRSTSSIYFQPSRSDLTP